MTENFCSQITYELNYLFAGYTGLGDDIKCDCYYFFTKCLNANHENVYNFSLQMTPYVMEWQARVFQKEPNAQYQLGMTVCYFKERLCTRETRRGSRELHFTFLEEREEFLHCDVYEEFDLRGAFENEVDFQREMMAVWQKAFYIGVPVECKRNRSPLLVNVMVKAYFTQWTCIFPYNPLVTSFPGRISILWR